MTITMDLPAFEAAEFDDLDLVRQEFAKHKPMRAGPLRKKHPDAVREYLGQLVTPDTQQLVRTIKNQKVHANMLLVMVQDRYPDYQPLLSTWGPARLLHDLLSWWLPHAE